MEHFEGLAHREIYDKVQAVSIGSITAIGEIWRDIANNLSAKLVGSRIALNRALSEGFDGEFAAAAESAANTFFAGAQNLQHATSTIAYRIGSVAGGAEAVKLSVPAPPSAPVSGEGLSDEQEALGVDAAGHHEIVLHSPDHGNEFTLGTREAALLSGFTGCRYPAPDLEQQPDL